MRLKSSLFFWMSFCVVACGGSQKPAEEPSSDAASSAAKDHADAESSAAEKADKKDVAKADEKKADSKSEAPSTEGPKVTRTPKDIITAPDTYFMFSWAGSDIKEEAEKVCDGEAKDDPKKRAKCLDKEKKKIDFDGMGFKQEKGQWYWLVIRRKGKTLVNLHKLPIEFGKEDDHSIVLKPAGKDEGTARGGAPGETKVEVPNEYQITIKDPKLGKTVYEAKIGLTGG